MYDSLWGSSALREGDDLDTCFLPQNEYQINYLRKNVRFNLDFVIGQRARSVLVDTFKLMTELKLLSISNSGDDDTIADLLRTISNNSHLQRFNLLLNNNINVDVKTVRAITGLLKKRKISAMLLRQEGEDFGKNAMKAISSVKDSGLEVLKLELDMGLDGVISLSKMLVKNKSITQLTIENSSINAEKLLQISKSIKTSSVTELGLPGNGLQDADMIPMQNLLRRSKLRLSVLHLSHNKIGDVGARYLSEVIARNLNIKYLDLTHNVIGEVGARLIALAWVSKGRTHLSTIRRYRNWYRFLDLHMNGNPGYAYFAEHFERHWRSMQNRGTAAGAA